MNKQLYIEYLKGIAGDDIKYESNRYEITDESINNEIYFFQRLLRGFGKHYLTEEAFYLKNKPQVDKEIRQLKIAFSLQGLDISENIIETFVETYNLIRQKNGDTSIQDCINVKKKVNKKYNQNYKYSYEIKK